MKLLLVHNSYQQSGGEDQVFTSELDLLASHGHEVLRYTAHNDAVRHLNKVSLAFRTTWSRTTYREMRAVLHRERPQIVHVHNTLPLLSPAVYYAARTAGVPVVQTLHNYRLLCPNAVLLRDRHICEDCLGRRVAWPGILHACYRQSRAATGAVATMLSVHRLLGTWTRQVNRYIALTEFMRQKFITGGFPAKRIVVKPHFVMADPGVGNHRGGYALFVGRLSPEKGVRTLLRAWDSLGGRLPLKILGEGPLQMLADESPPGIEWLGHQPRTKVFALMQEASMLIFPSECYEGFGVTMVEAFATGLPVVASDLGAMAEIVQHRHTGLLFIPGNAEDLAEKVEWALGYPSELTDMGRRARREFEAKYTAERNYQRLLDIYHTVLDEELPRQPSAMESAFSDLRPDGHAQPNMPAAPTSGASGSELGVAAAMLGASGDPPRTSGRAQGHRYDA
jgi:glycosyltransferase involved in cell wall biosynthesis